MLCPKYQATFMKALNHVTPAHPIVVASPTDCDELTTNHGATVLYKGDAVWLVRVTRAQLVSWTGIRRPAALQCLQDHPTHAVVTINGDEYTLHRARPN